MPINFQVPFEKIDADACNACSLCSPWQVNIKGSSFTWQNWFAMLGEPTSKDSDFEGIMVATH